MPRVWNKRDPACPTDAVYVGRPTKWGNPYSHLPSHDPNVILVPTRADAIRLYQDWFLTTDAGKRLLDQLEQLRGKHLVCWCAPKDCHADFLLELANG
jgi:uncharacterized protein DUF4326